MPLAVGVAALAGAAAMIAAPALDQHSPWLNYQALAGTLVARHVEAFDWSQRYGPLNWPRTGTRCSTCKAQHPDYWKAEDLDLFAGTGGRRARRPRRAGAVSQTPPRSPRWTQTIQVTLRAMRTRT